MSKANSFHDITVTTTDFPSGHHVKFPWVASKILIMNDSLKEIYYSFNGKDIDGKLEWDDYKHMLSEVTVGRIWFKTASPDANIRIYAWERI